MGVFIFQDKFPLTSRGSYEIIVLPLLRVWSERPARYQMIKRWDILGVIIATIALIVELFK